MRCEPLILLTLLGCSAPDGALIDHNAWIPLDAANDPSTHRPAELDCPSSAWFIEAREGETTLDVNTGLCNYFAVSQAAPKHLRAGDQVEFVLAHGNLLAPGPAEAHWSLSIGEVVLFEKTEPIPSPSAVWTQAVTLDASFPEGAPITFHLHNHGDNSWGFRTLVKCGDTLPCVDDGGDGE